MVVGIVLYPCKKKVWLIEVQRRIVILVEFQMVDFVCKPFLYLVVQLVVDLAS